MSYPEPTTKADLREIESRIEARLNQTDRRIDAASANSSAWGLFIIVVVGLYSIITWTLYH
jgi:hypothetical protein